MSSKVDIVFNNHPDNPADPAGSVGFIEMPRMSGPENAFIIDKLTQKLESAGRRNGFSCTQQKRNQLQAYSCLQPSPCRIAYYIYGFLFFIIKRQAFPAVF